MPLPGRRSGISPIYFFYHDAVYFIVTNEIYSDYNFWLQVADRRDREKKAYSKMFK